MMTLRLFGQQEHNVAQTSSVSFGCSSANYKIHLILEQVSYWQMNGIRLCYKIKLMQATKTKLCYKLKYKKVKIILNC